MSNKVFRRVVRQALRRCCENPQSFTLLVAMKPDAVKKIINGRLIFQRDNMSFQSGSWMRTQQDKWRMTMATRQKLTSR